MAHFIGLMSGTSLDGVDGVLVSWPDAGPGGLQVLAHRHQPFEPALRTELLALNTPGPDELHRSALASNALARAYAQVVQALLASTGLPAAEVAALGAHGQTVRHRPGEFDGIGYTLQLLNGALLAELTGIEVACDFRPRDLAAGGQGAPLVPAFHAAQFGRPGETLAVLNLGGIANLSLLDELGGVRGFDCGPGNVLLDLWCARATGQSFDRDGALAAQGRVDATWLAELIASEPFFDRAPPKSTGRDLFHADWLWSRLAGRESSMPAADIQATLAELTAQSAASALRRHLPRATGLLVCGGGAFNAHLMRRLAHALPGVPVDSTARAGLPPDQVEAVAFAWLARARLRGEPGNRPEVTGARGLRVLGALHPAR
jgi:anhydro-N-acetylmuramic acid kinase